MIDIPRDRITAGHPASAPNALPPIIVPSAKTDVTTTPPRARPPIVPPAIAPIVRRFGRPVPRQSLSPLVTVPYQPPVVIELRSPAPLALAPMPAITVDTVRAVRGAERGEDPPELVGDGTRTHPSDRGDEPARFRPPPPPRARPRARGRIGLTQGAWALAGVLFVLMAAYLWTGQPYLLVAMGIGLGCYGVAALTVRRGPDLTVAIDLDCPRTTVGERATCVLTLSASAAVRRATLTVSIGEHTEVVSVPSFAARARRTVPVAIPTRRRGVVRLGPATITWTDPLRLLRRRDLLAGEGSIIVRPRMGDDDPLAGVRLPTGRGPQVAECESFVIAMSSRAADYGSTDDVELALEVAAALTAHCRSRGWQVTVCHGDQVLSGHPEAILDGLARLDAANGSSVDGFAMVADLAPADASIVVLISGAGCQPGSWRRAARHVPSGAGVMGLQVRAGADVEQMACHEPPIATVGTLDAVALAVEAVAA